MSKSPIFSIIAFIIIRSSMPAQTCPLSVAKSANSVCPGFQSTLTAFGANSYTWTGGTLSAPVSSQSVAVGAGSYTVTGNTHPCTMVVTVGTAPPLNIQISRSSATTCITSNSPVSSHPVTLTATGASNYTWTPPAPQPPFSSANYTVRPMATSCYAVLGTTAACSGSAIACVTVIPQFSIALSTEASTICAGQPLGLSVTKIGFIAVGPPSAFTYVWTNKDSTVSTGNNNTLNAIASMSSGYTVTVLDARNCASIPATASVTVNVCTDIAEQETNRTSIFPNPFYGYLEINTGDAVLIEITDALAKEVMNLRPGAERTCRLDTDRLPPGIYFVTITNAAQQKSVLKLIKN